MYLRTPKRYRPGRRRQLRLFSRRALAFLILTPLLVAAAWYIWEHREEMRETVLPGIGERIESLADSARTQIAPQPAPTATPDLQTAQTGCVNAYRQGNIGEAIEQCSILAEGSPNDVDIHYQVTHMLIITSNFGSDTERLNQALDFAEKTINANPEAPHGWAIRAMALDWSGDYGSALASALHAKALDANFAPTYAFLGEIYTDLRQFEIADSYLDQAIELDTTELALADTYRNRGLLYSTQPGQREEAIQNYEIALQLAPNYSYIAVELALNYIAMGQVDTAIDVLRVALELHPNDTAVLFAIARAFINNGENERAYEYYQRCLDVDPDNVPCLSWLGGLQFYNGNYVAAINNLDRAIELGSTDPDDFLQIGRAHAAMDRCDLARPYLEQGYQIVVAREDYDQQASFASTLQSCGVIIRQQPSDSPPSAGTGQQ